MLHVQIALVTPLAIASPLAPSPQHYSTEAKADMSQSIFFFGKIQDRCLIKVCLFQDSSSDDSDSEKDRKKKKKKKKKKTKVSADAHRYYLEKPSGQGYD